MLPDASEIYPQHRASDSGVGAEERRDSYTEAEAPKAHPSLAAASTSVAPPTAAAPSAAPAHHSAPPAASASSFVHYNVRAMAATRIEGSLEQLTYTKGVVGLVVATRDGVPIRDTFQDMDRSLAIAYAAMAADVVGTATPLYKIKGEGDVEMIRIRTRTNEVIIKCNAKYLIAIVQEPSHD